MESTQGSIEYFGNAKINLHYGLKSKDFTTLIDSIWLDVKEVEAYLVKNKTTILFNDLISF